MFLLNDESNNAINDVVEHCQDFQVSFTSDTENNCPNCNSACVGDCVGGCYSSCQGSGEHYY